MCKCVQIAHKLNIKALKDRIFKLGVLVPSTGNILPVQVKV